MNSRIFIAEAVGTAVLVLGGVGSAVLASSSIGVLGVALAFGLSQAVMCYAIGPISGSHINPAVSLGMLLAGRIDSRQLPIYWGAQVLGAVVGAGLLFLVAHGLHGFSAAAAGFGANGYGMHSPKGYSLGAVALTEVLFTSLFVFVVLAATHRGFPVGFGGATIGVMLSLVHLVTIPVSNTSVNPARSLGPALFQGHWALGQLWAFILFPLLGAVVGAALYKLLLGGGELGLPRRARAAA